MTDTEQFHEACERGGFDKASELIDRVDPREGWGPRLMTPLHWASHYGCLSFVKLLIARYRVHACPTLLSSHEETPLHLACVEGHIDVVRYLVEDGGCDPDARQRGFRRPPITYACGISTIPSFHYSDDGRALEVVRYLFAECGCDPNWRDAFGMTAFHNAAINRRVNLVRYLLVECGCNPTETDAVGNNGVHLACWQSDYKPASDAVAVIRFLVVHFGLDPSATNHHGEQPIDLTDELDVVAELVSYGAQGRKAGMYKNPRTFMAHANPR